MTQPLSLPPPPPPPAPAPASPVIELAPVMMIPAEPPEAPKPAPMLMAMPAPPPTDAPSLRARYGAPDFIRREMDSELWRYDAENCAIFFFLYREGDGLKLRYSETMPRGMNMPADPACLENLNARAAPML